MKSILVSFILSASVSAFAHVEVGEHQGLTADGQVCSLIAGEQTFENNQHHPLNERIEIQVGGDTFKVGHPAVIDAEKGTAFFNHDLFQGVLATSTGAKALVIEMAHTATKEGPASFTLINSNWKTGESTKLVCAGLEFKK